MKRLACLLPALAALAACGAPVDRSHLPQPKEAGWSAVTANSKFSVGGHLDLTDAVLRGLRGRDADQVSPQDVGEAYEAEAKRHINLALEGKSDDECKSDLEQMVRLSEASGTPDTRQFFREVSADAKISWREKLRRAVTYAYRAVKPQTERIVFDAVRKVGEFQKRNAWRNPDAINLVLKCNTATDLLGFDGKCYMFLLYILYPSASGQIEDVARLIADMPRGIRFNGAGSDGFHFDDLFHYDDIERRWNNLRAWTRHQAIRTQARWEEGGRDDFLRVIGISTHSVQDFYCHSNWVHILCDFIPTDNPEDFPIWTDLVGGALVKDPALPAGPALGFKIDLTLREPTPGLRYDRQVVLARMKESNKAISEDPEKGGLQSGAWDHEEIEADGKVIHPWSHRHPEEVTREGLISPSLAARATEAWVDELLDYLDERHRQDLINYISARK